MSALADQRTSGMADDVYVPDFLIEVEGQALDADARRDVIELKVSLDIDELASVELELSNVGAQRYDLKWSDAAFFKLGGRMHVQLGYVGALVSVFRGPITTLSPQFVPGTVSTLKVRALDPLVALRDSHPPEDQVAYPKKSDRQIAEAVAERHSLRFENTGTDGPSHELVVQRNVDDLTFLRERAARSDNLVYTHVDPSTGENTLRWGPPADGRDGTKVRTYVFAWGTLGNLTGVAPNLIEFKPTISSADQVQSVTLRGVDAKAKKAYSVTATPATTPGVKGAAGTTGPDAAAKLGAAARKLVAVNAPAQTEEEARELAEALLAERAYRFLTATGKAVGVPELRPGDNVEIHGTGDRFNGTYFVTAAVHTLNARGLVTEFKARKTYEGA